MSGNVSCDRTRIDFCVPIGVALLAADTTHCINYFNVPSTNTGPTNRGCRAGVLAAGNGRQMTGGSDGPIQGLFLMRPITPESVVNMPRIELVKPLRV